MFKETIQKWVQAIGEPKAKGRLIARGMGPTMVDRLVRGKWSHEPLRVNRAIILDEMAKDGFVLTDEAV